jgi:prepilin-type N-terminal cleavage/methylation domain-containing protein
MTPASAPSDAGFALVEMLVALAIAALVSMAIGGLFVAVSSVRDRIAEAEEVQRALLDVEAVGQRVSQRMDVAMINPSVSGFDLSQKDGDAVDHVVLDLRQRRSMRFVVGERQLTADLAQFTDVKLEYLLRVGAQLLWKQANALAGQSPLAARLRLGLKGRVWRPLVWAAPPSAWQGA